MMNLLTLDPSDYLALAIRAHDAAAIDLCKNIVALESASGFLQTTLFIDAIVKKMKLYYGSPGTSFPSIFTTFYAFILPRSFIGNFSGFESQLIKKIQSSKTMLKFVPCSHGWRFTEVD